MTGPSVLPHDLQEWGASLLPEPVKDEFENSVEFGRRIEAYSREITRFNEARAAWLSGLPLGLPKLALARVLARVLGDQVPPPVVEDLRYDADRHLLFATLGPGDMLTALELPTVVAL